MAFDSLVLHYNGPEQPIALTAADFVNSGTAKPAKTYNVFGGGWIKFYSAYGAMNPKFSNGKLALWQTTPTMGANILFIANDGNGISFAGDWTWDCWCSFAYWVNKIEVVVYIGGAIRLSYNDPAAGNDKKPLLFVSGVILKGSAVNDYPANTSLTHLCVQQQVVNVSAAQYAKVHLSQNGVYIGFLWLTQAAYNANCALGENLQIGGDGSSDLSLLAMCEAHFRQGECQYGFADFTPPTVPYRNPKIQGFFTW